MICNLKSGLICATLALAILATPAPTLTGSGKAKPLNVSLTSIPIFSEEKPAIIPGDSYFDIEQRTIEHQLANDRDQLARMAREAKLATIRVPDPDNAEVRDQIFEAAKARWGEDQAFDAIWIVNNESGFKQYITNGNCCGLFQRLNRCSQEILSDLPGQIEEVLDYIAGRYQTPDAARYFWEVTSVQISGHHWY